MANKKEIPVDEIQDLQPTETDEEVQKVAEVHGVSPKTVVRRIKGLNITAKSDKGDVSPPPLSSLSTDNGTTGEPIVDYQAVAKSMILMSEMALKTLAMVSKGKIEYEPLSPSEINLCTTQLQTQTKILDVVNGAPVISTLMAVGVIGVTFMSHVHIKKSPAKKELTEEEKNALQQEYVEPKGAYDLGENIKPSKIMNTRKHQEALKAVDDLPAPQEPSIPDEETDKAIDDLLRLVK